MDNDQTLTVQLMHARARIAELEAKYEDTQAANEALSAELAYRKVQSAEPKGLSTKHEVPKHFAAAREAAMRFGRSVSVTA